jgi:hypothetical protein
MGLMTDRMTALLLERLRSLAMRKDRFCYDVRGNSHIYHDVVAAYEMDGIDETDLERVLQHAMEHDSIVSGRRDPVDGMMRYTSCRLFTDVQNAVRFARDQRRPSVFNWNRLTEIPVEMTEEASVAPVAVAEQAE